MGPKQKYSSTFRETWLDPEKFPDYALWLRRDPASKHNARCCLCDSSFSIAGGGKSQVDSHAKGDGHKRLIRNASGQFQLSEFMQQRPRSGVSDTASSTPAPVDHPITIDIESTSTPLSTSTPSLPSTSSVHSSNPYIIREQTVRAEIIAAMNCLEKRFSYNSFRDFTEVLSAMAPDSEIIKSMQLGATKVAYVIAYGLAPYFKEKLIAGK